MCALFANLGAVESFPRHGDPRGSRTTRGVVSNHPSAAGNGRLRVPRRSPARATDRGPSRGARPDRISVRGDARLEPPTGARDPRPVGRTSPAVPPGRPVLRMVHGERSPPVTSISFIGRSQRATYGHPDAELVIREARRLHIVPRGVGYPTPWPERTSAGANMRGTAAVVIDCGAAPEVTREPARQVRDPIRARARAAGSITPFVGTLGRRWILVTTLLALSQYVCERRESRSPLPRPQSLPIDGIANLRSSGQ